MASTLVDARRSPGEEPSRPAPGDGTRAAPAGDGSRPSRPAWLAPTLILVAASSLLAVCVGAHAMWFDEVQAWNLARASHSLGDLFANLRYEGHPAVWYLPLFALTRVTGNPRAMQVLEWAIVTATYAVILLKAPFRLGVRAAIIGGYFVTYEYGVISRSYSLELLFLVVALVLLARPRPAWGRVALLLMLLTWTSLAGGVLAIALGLGLGMEALRQRKAGAERRVWRSPLSAGVVAIGSALAAAVVCIPPSDYHSFALGIPSTPLTTFSSDRFLVALSGPWRGLVPLPSGIGRWNTNLLDTLPQSVTIEALLGVVLAVAVAVALRHHRVAFRVWVLGALGYVAFSYVVVLPDRSHYAGEWFVLFLAAAWLAAAPPGEARTEGDPLRLRGGSAITLGAVVAIVLGAQLVATLAILPDQTLHEFAPDRSLAATATTHGLAHDIVSAQDLDAVTMSAYLEQPVYSIARRTDIAFFPNDEREALGYAHLTSADIVCRAASIAGQRRRAVALVTDRALDARAGMTMLRTSHGVTLWQVEPGTSTAACSS